MPSVWQHTGVKIKSLTEAISSRIGGNKGVVASIVPDEYMPVDDHGIRADIISDPLSVFNRMNPSQWIEQLVNRISEFVRRRTEELRNAGQYDEAFSYLIEYFSDINPKYGELLANKFTSQYHQHEWVDYCIENGICTQHSPFQKDWDQNVLKAIAEKYGVFKTPVTFSMRDETGQWRQHRTKKPILIGNEYWYLLYKIPHMRCCGVGYVNQYHIPSKPDKAMRYQTPFATTSVRFGEDEFRQLVMIVGPMIATRISALHGLSPVATDALVEYLLYSEKPGTLKQVPISTEEATGTNTIRSLLIHLFSAIGIDIQKDLDGLPSEDLDKYITAEELGPAFVPRARKTRKSNESV